MKDLGRRLHRDPSMITRLYAGYVVKRTGSLEKAGAGDSEEISQYSCLTPISHHNCYNLHHDPGERYPDLTHYCLWAAPGFVKMIQEHMAMIEKFSHRMQKGYQREFDRPFDPEK